MHLPQPTKLCRPQSWFSARPGHRHGLCRNKKDSRGTTSPRTGERTRQYSIIYESNMFVSFILKRLECPYMESSIPYNKIPRVYWMKMCLADPALPHTMGKKSCQHVSALMTIHPVVFRKNGNKHNL